MAKRKLPTFIDGTLREFRQRKRREYRDMVRAIEVYSLASAYTPKQAYADFQEARLRMLSLGKALSTKAWGR